MLMHWLKPMFSKMEQPDITKTVEYSAVCKQILSRLPSFSRTFPPANLAVIETSQKDHDQLVKWAEGITDITLKRAYDRWLWYWQYTIDETLEEIRSHKAANRHKTYLAKINNENEAVYEYMKHEPLPSLPERKV